MIDEKPRSRQEAELDLLSSVLKEKYWDFSGGGVGHFSRGVCLMVGFVPEQTNWNPQELGVQFLPGALKSMGFEKYPSYEDAWQLQDLLIEALQVAASIGLRGRVEREKALLSAWKSGVIPPWVEAAAACKSCARQLPPDLRGNPEVAKQLQREAARKGGKSRAAGNKVTEALKGRCFEEFKRLKEEDWAKSDLVTQAKRPVATKIADEIVQRVSCGEGALPDDAVPSPVTLADHVRKWLKNSSADKPLNGS